MHNDTINTMTRLGLAVGSSALAAISSVAGAQQPQAYPQSQNRPAYAQQPSYPQASNLPPRQEPTPPPAPGQIDRNEARRLMQDPEYIAGFRQFSGGNFRLTPIQVQLPIWNNGLQGEYVKAATVFLTNFADDVMVMAEQTTSSTMNSKLQNGVLAGAALAFTDIAAQKMDQLTINWPFQDIVARSGRDPQACAVVVREGDPVNLPQNRADPEALRIKMFRIADQARRLSVCLDESVPIGSSLHLGKPGGWLDRHTNIQVQQPPAQGPHSTVDLARRTTETVDILASAQATMHNILRANASLTPEGARQILQGGPGPQGLVIQPENPSPDIRLTQLARPARLTVAENSF